MTEWAVLTAAAFVTATLSGTIGLGGGSVLMVLMLTMMGPAQAIPVHGVVQAVATGYRVYLFRRHTVWRLVRYVLVLMVPGVAVGLWLFRGLPEQAIRVAIGVFILTALGLGRVSWTRSGTSSDAALFPLGFVAGALSMVVGGVGVLFAPFVIRPGLSKAQVVGTQATMASLTHVAKVAAFGMAGFSFYDYGPLLALLVPAVVAGGYVGKRLLGHVPEGLFRGLYYAVLIGLAGKQIVWDGLLKISW